MSNIHYTLSKLHIEARYSTIVLAWLLFAGSALGQPTQNNLPWSDRDDRQAIEQPAGASAAGTSAALPVATLKNDPTPPSEEDPEVDEIDPLSDPSPLSLRALVDFLQRWLR